MNREKERPGQWRAREKNGKVEWSEEQDEGWGGNFSRRSGISVKENLAGGNHAKYVRSTPHATDDHAGVINAPLPRLTVVLHTK
jgi:hypothetical protein